MEAATKTDPIEFANGLISAIVTTREKALLEKAKPRERASIYASGISECSRQMVYDITHWKEREMWGAASQARMDRGNAEEDLMVRELEDLGFRIVERQAPLSEDMRRVYGIGGRIDGKLVWQERRIPLEVKSVNPRLFDQINALEDLNRWPWMRKYPKQLRLYLLGHNEEVGILALSNMMGAWKFIPVPLDYGAAEEVLKTVEGVRDHIKAGTLPDRIAYDSDICGMCAFSTICLPDLKNNPSVKWMDNPKLVEKLDRRRELAPLAKEYKKLDEEVKETFDGAGPTTVIGEYIVERKVSNRKGYAVEPSVVTTTKVVYTPDATKEDA